MRRVSKKRAATFSQRAQLVADVKERDGGCVFWATVWGERGRTDWITGDLEGVDRNCWGILEVHEVIARGVRPSAELEPDLCVTLCSAHHRFVTENPAKAQRIGLRGNSWDFDKFKEGRRL